MSQIQTSIELHDSNLSDCKFYEGMLVIELRPAYIHKWEMLNGKWIGTGWVQDAKMRIDNASVSGKMPTVPVEISDGMISSGGSIFTNLISVPFNMNGPCRLKLQLVSGDVLEVSGRAINIEMQGEATFVENLPEEWSPKTTE